MKDADAKQKMRDVAASYEKLAQQLVRQAVSRGSDIENLTGFNVVRFYSPVFLGRVATNAKS